MGECIQVGPLETGSFNPRTSCKCFLDREVRGCYELNALMMSLYVHFLPVLVLST
jgi:hypothetical protein